MPFAVSNYRTVAKPNKIGGAYSVTQLSARTTVNGLLDDDGLSGIVV